ncbi:MAG: FAD-binding oxidoreductase [Candidatus Abyssobacteria bacterium SURF_17]|uniref:FAD-binding oxidoreductase n=1 Tax=Candidatus Abyssobacteria bacterium SURF_17 TaxID=2093361 RepID=A0A419ETG1_9BACT|nr:MAG: FAD-binding oxidoreductase [Candidatus Abyssubacteria bacterium SURF_17]
MSEKTSFYPDWTSEPPRPGTYRSIFKWGDPSAFKHPNRRLYVLLKEQFQMSDADFKQKQHEGNEPVRCEIPSRLTAEQVNAFRGIVGQENVAADDYSRVKYSSGKTMEEIMKLRSGIVDEVPDLVLHPRNKDDVEKVVKYCNEQMISIYPYGGGSSVTLGLRCVQGGVSLALSTHMNRVLEFNEADQTVTVEPGILGPAYEAILNDAPAKLNAKRRYTGGHFPQSFEYSSVGGWIAALGSGQQSSYYGDMYSIVLSQEYVTPAGSFKTHVYPGTATGPKVNDMMKGSEGAYGVLVSATLRVFRYTPENRQRFAFIFPTWEAAVDGAREISQGEFGMPSVFRISDPEETVVALRLYGVEGTFIDKIMTLRGYKPMQRCLYIGQGDGERGFARNMKKNVKKICRDYGAMYITGYPLKNWEHGRFADPYMREDLNDFSIMIDTLETGVTWSNFHNLYKGVRGLVKSRPKTVCMTHASHFYPQGTNLYFIFIARMNDIDEYRAFQEAIIDQIQRYGGSLSHHHGIGKMIAPWMELHLGKAQMEVLRTLKRHFDPNNIMNPGGTLGLDLPDSRKRPASK